jgi:hypothetical protein
MFTVIPLPIVIVIIEIAVIIKMSLRIQNHGGERSNSDVSRGFHYNGRPYYNCRWERL